MALAPEVALLESTVYPIALASPRVAALFTVLPFFSGQMFTGLVRGGVIVMLAMFLAPAAGPLPEPGLANVVLIAAKEALIGAMLGLGFGVLIWAVQSMGDLIDIQTGSSSAEFFDPVGGHQGGRMGELLGWLVVTLFVTAGGMLALVQALIDSFQLWPVASFVPRFDRVLELFAIHQGDTLLQWVVKLALPVVMVLLLADIGIGLVGRAAPQLDIFVFALPVKQLLALLMLILLMFYLYESLQVFLHPDNSVLRFLRGAI